MNITHYIGFDVHKKSISYCVKNVAGEIVEEGKLPAQRAALRQWAERQQQPWRGAMEATLFSAWIYDTLKPYAQRLDMAHPARMKAIASGKKKSDQIDARMIADLLRCNLLPVCYVLSPELRDLRRLLRYRNLVVRESVRMQNKMAGLLMESGAPFNKTKLHGKKYFANLLKTLEEVPESVKDLLRMSRGAMEMFETTQKRLVGRLLAEPALGQRVERLASIRGIGEITALTWALEIADPHRFSSHADAMSYCGLTAALRSSAGKEQRGPISKQRNAWLQTALIEAAKLAPRWNPQLAVVHARELERGHRNRAGRRQEWATVPGSHPSLRSRNHNPRRQSWITRRPKSCGNLEIQPTAAGFPNFHSSDYGYQTCFRFVSDSPAGPRVLGDWARGLLLPMLLTVCFGVGRFTLTQSSWTALPRRSRKWMSGHAALALVAPSDRGQFGTAMTTTAIRESFPLSAGESPFPLDIYLSWMSPVFSQFFRVFCPQFFPQFFRAVWS